MLGRMQRPADFEHALAIQARARSAHFAAHHVARVPSRGAAGPARPSAADLSTGDPKACAQPVDEPVLPAPDRCWFGTVVPKRHARKAATRNLLRRQIRAAMERHHAALAHGLWLVRLRAPFDARRYHSAASAALRAAARDELDALLTRAAA
ncbi:MAG TPA: ribonuclease P protein component [Burkholderiaceae bacterium]